MKHYKASNDDYEIINEGTVISNADYLNSNSSGNEKYVILYSKDGYSSSKKPYIKNDKKLDKQETLVNEDNLSKGRLSSNTTTKDVRIESIIESFTKGMIESRTARYVLKYMKKLPIEEHWRLKKAWVEKFNYLFCKSGEEAYMPQYLEAEAEFNKDNNTTC